MKKFIEITIFACVCFLLLWVPLLHDFLKLSSDSFEMPKYSAVQFILLLGTFLLICRKAFYERALALVKTSVQVYPAVFLFVCLFSFLFSPDAYNSCYDFYKLAICVLVYFFFVNAVPENRIQTILQVAVFSAGIVALIGVLQFYGYDYSQLCPPGTPVISTLANQNFLSEYIIAMIPVALVMVLRKESGRYFRYAYGAVLVLMIMCLFFTKTRGTFIGFIGSGILFVIIMVKKFRIKAVKWAVIAVVAVVIGVVVFSVPNPLNKSTSSLLDRYKTILDFEQSDVKYRLFLWKNVGMMLKDRPLFGLGIGGIQYNYPYYQAVTRRGFDFGKTSVLENRSHNEFLQITAETGIIGAGVFLLMIFIIFRAGLKIINKSAESSPDDFWIVTACLCGITAVLFHALFSFPFHLIVTMTMFWMFVGIIDLKSVKYGDYGNAEKSNFKRDPAFASPNGFVVALSAGFLITASLLLATEFASEIHFRVAKDAVHPDNPERNYENAAREMELALDLSRDRITLHSTLWHDAGTALLSVNEVDKARSIFEKLIKKNPSETAFTNLASAYYMKTVQGDTLSYLKIIKLYKKSLYLDPGQEETHYNLGVVYKNIGRNDLAVKEFEQVLELNPDAESKRKTHMFLANLYMQLGKPEISAGHVQAVAGLAGLPAMMP